MSPADAFLSTLTNMAAASAIVGDAAVALRAMSAEHTNMRVEARAEDTDIFY